MLGEGNSKTTSFIIHTEELTFPIVKKKKDSKWKVVVFFWKIKNETALLKHVKEKCNFGNSWKTRIHRKCDSCV